MSKSSYKNKIINEINSNLDSDKIKEMKKAFEEGCYLDQIFLTQRAVNKLLDYKLSDEFAMIGTTPKQAILIKIIHDHKRLTNDELSKATNVVCSTITRTLDKMAKDNVIQRSKEGKNSFASLTARGEDIYSKIKEIEHRIETWIIDVVGKTTLDEYLNLLKDVEDKIYKNLRKFYSEDSK